MQKTVKVVEVKTGNNGRVDLYYTALDGTTHRQPGPDKAGNLASKIPEDSLKLLKGSTAGDVLEITLVKEGNFWPLTSVTKAGTGGTYKQTTTYPPQTAKKPFDDVGVKVGAARNQALAFLSATRSGKFTLDEVDATAYEIVLRQQKQEDNIRADKNPAQTKTDVVAESWESSDEDKFFPE